MESGYYSIIAHSLLHPIVNLWEKLDFMDVKNPNEVQTSQYENGYAAGIILLAVIMVESSLVRTHAIKKERGELAEKGTAKNPVSFFKEHFSGVGLAEDLEELFVIRDVLAHNHPWEATIQHSGGLSFRGLPTLDEGQYGDKKFRRVIDRNKRQSKRLGLNLFPTRVWRKDAVTVLAKAYQILKAVEDVDRMYCYLSVQPVTFKGKSIEFSEFIKLLPTISE